LQNMVITSRWLPVFTTASLVSLLWGFGVDGESACSNSRDVRAMRDLIQSADVLPAPFAADLMLRLSSRPEAGTPKQRIRLINDAFESTTSVQRTCKVVTLSRSIDTRSGLISVAAEQPLDALSLQARAVLAMWDLDRRRAVDLLRDIRKPTIDEPGCGNALIADPSIYFVTLAQLSSSLPSLPPGIRKEILGTIIDSVSGVQLNTEVAPAAALITHLNTDTPAIAQMTALFASALRNMHGDLRSFVLTDNSAPDELLMLLRRMREEHIPTRPLIDAIHQYLLSNLTAPQCKDLVRSFAAKAAPISSSPGLRFDPNVFRLVQVFNRRLRYLSEPPGPEIVVETLSNQEGPNLSDVPYWTTPKSKALLERIRHLGEAKGSVSVTAWTDAVRDLLGALGEWTPADEASAEDYYYQRCLIYRRLLELLGPGDLRALVLAEFRLYLEQSYSSFVDKTEWFAPVSDYFNARKGNTYALRLTGDLAISSNSIINVYSTLLCIQ
jgi:hypothetical protein